MATASCSSASRTSDTFSRELSTISWTRGGAKTSLRMKSERGHDADFVLVLIVHGLIHLLGSPRPLDWRISRNCHSPSRQLTDPQWLLAALLFLASAGSLLVWPRGWWLISSSAQGPATIHDDQD